MSTVPLTTLTGKRPAWVRYPAHLFTATCATNPYLRDLLARRSDVLHDLRDAREVNSPDAEVLRFDLRRLDGEISRVLDAATVIESEATR